MCPACLGIATWAALSAGSAGAVGALTTVVRRATRTRAADAPPEREAAASSVLDAPREQRSEPTVTTAA